MNLFNDFVCPLGTSLNMGYIVNKTHSKQSSVEIWHSFSVLKAGMCITAISSRCGDVEHKIGAKYLAADICGRC